MSDLSPVPDFAWYRAQSDARKLPPRCPFAGVDRCPRFYESLIILKRAGVIAGVSKDDEERLDAKWRAWFEPVAEKAPAVMGVDDRFVGASNICPEVGYDVFRYFGTSFHRHADESDAGFAHEWLAKQAAPSDHPLWHWSTVREMHYTECPMYSTLATAVMLDEAERIAPKVRAKPRKAKIPPSLRWQVFARDGFVCKWCGRRPPAVALVADHEVAEAKGGPTTLANLVTSCEECNGGKGTKDVPPAPVTSPPATEP